MSIMFVNQIYVKDLTGSNRYSKVGVWQYGKTCFTGIIFGAAV